MKKHSIRRIYQIMIWTLLPVAVLMFITNFAIRRQMMDYISSNVEHNLTISQKRLETSCSNVDYSLLTLLLGSNEIDHMDLAGSRFEQYQLLLSLQERLTELSGSFSNEFCFFYFNSEDQSMIKPATFSGYGALTIQESIRAKLAAKPVPQGITSIQWDYHALSARNGYLLRVYRNGAHCLGAWLDTDHIADGFGMNQYSGTGNLMLLSKDGEIVYTGGNSTQIHTDDPTFMQRLLEGVAPSDHILLTQDLAKSPVRFLFVINAFSNFRQLSALLTLFLCIALVICFIGVIMLIQIRTKLLKPLKQMMQNDTLRKAMTNGETSAGEKPLRLWELEQLDALMSDAQVKIEELKTSVYKKELEKRRIEMEMLQFQIRPHFYINCLTIIFSMAQSQKYKDIQEFSMLVADYMRDLFHTGTRLVKVQDELRRVENYLRINSIRYRVKIDTCISLDKQTDELYIPPLIIQTLTENCVVHTLDLQEDITVEISVRSLEKPDGVYARITVCDNGEGFPAETLKGLNEGLALEQNGHHIGLSNTMRRVRYYCGTKATFSFENLPAGGAKVEIVLPWLTDSNQEPIGG